MDDFDLDGLRMNATTTAENGVIGVDTIFRFAQAGGVATASYAGGGILAGHLIGLVRGAMLEFRYVQLERGNVLSGGHSRCQLERAPDGRVRILEHFEWASREGTGTNVIEELR